MDAWRAPGKPRGMALTLREIVAANVRRLRLERGYSQEELAHRVGIDRNYVGMIERRKNSPTIDMIERLARALKVEPLALLQREKSR